VTDRPRALAVLIAVFLLGCVLGSAGSYMWFRSRPVVEPRMTRGGQRGGSPMARLTELLKLTPEQDAKRREIMAESFKELNKLRAIQEPKVEPLFHQLEELRKEQEPQIDALLSGTNRKIMAILNPEQQKKFADFLKDAENRRRRGPYGGRGMGPMSPMGDPSDQRRPNREFRP